MFEGGAPSTPAPASDSSQPQPNTQPQPHTQRTQAANANPKPWAAAGPTQGPGRSVQQRSEPQQGAGPHSEPSTGQLRLRFGALEAALAEVHSGAGGGGGRGAGGGRRGSGTGRRRRW